MFARSEAEGLRLFDTQVDDVDLGEPGIEFAGSFDGLFGVGEEEGSVFESLAFQAMEEFPEFHAMQEDGVRRAEKAGRHHVDLGHVDVGEQEQAGLAKGEERGLPDEGKAALQFTGTVVIVVHFEVEVGERALHICVATMPTPPWLAPKPGLR